MGKLRARTIWLWGIIAVAVAFLMALSRAHPASAAIQPIYSLPFYDSFSVSQGFNPPSHYGIDYNIGAPLTPGEAVAAAASGIAKRCPFDLYGAGYYLVMSHTNGTGHRTRYLHLNGEPIPIDGANVVRGQVIGNEGSTGDASGPHLHFETRVDATTFTCGFDGTAVDPNLEYTTNPPSYSASTCYYPLNSANAGNLPGVFRPQPASTTWYERFSNSAGDANRSVAFGSTCDVPFVGDWNHDGVDTVGVFRPYGATGSEWYISNNIDGSNSAVYVFGLPTDWPVIGDWNGDGFTTIGVWRPSTATWYLRNANNSDVGMVTPFSYGIPNTDKPVVGDWDADGDTNIGVLRPSDYTWWLNALNQNGPPTTLVFQYGAAGDTPITGDWNYDNRDTIGVFRATGLTADWYLRNTNNAGGQDIPVFTFGVISDKPVSGDWN